MKGGVAMEAVRKIPCCHCGILFTPGRRNKGQRFCGAKVCQRARKAAWQRGRMKTDPAYRANQKQAYQVWAADHPGYWKDYRAGHPDKARRNRLLQCLRNRKRRSPGSVIAKMDAFKVNLYGFSEPCP